MRNSERGEGEPRFVGCLVQLVIFVVLPLVLGGQWRTDIGVSWPSPRPGGATTTTTTTTFEETFTARHWLLGLVKGEQPDLRTATRKYLRGQERMVALRRISATTSHRFVDNLICGATVLVYCPMTVTVRGEMEVAR